MSKDVHSQEDIIMNTRKQIEQWVKDGKSALWMAKQIGVGESTIWRWRKKWGIEPLTSKSKSFTPKPPEETVEKKTGVESRCNDKIVINWTNRSIVTYLGTCRKST